jgi:hypothetical protein
MAKKSKAECETQLVNHILAIGLESHMSMYGEGRKRNNLYYQFSLKDGTQRHWVNMSAENLKRLGIKEGEASERI